MNKIYAVLILVVIGMMTAACSTSVNKSTTTHVKDLVQSDVFSVLPESGQEIKLYTNPDEIEGEYLELATVQIQETAGENSTQDMMEMLKKEARNLGGNGVLLVESKTNEKGSTVTKEVKAIAVYTLDKIPAENQLVLL